MLQERIDSKKMYLPSVALALLILIASHGGYAYPGGAPTSICNTSPGVFLRPGASHGDPQSGNGGFLISTDLPVSTSNGGGYDYAAGKLYTGRIVYLSRFFVYSRLQKSL